MWLALDMMTNQLPFVLSRIDSPSGAESYLTARNLLYDIIRVSDNVAQARAIITQTGVTAIVPYSEWDLFGTKDKHRKLAVEHVRDILNSIETRFISGGSKSYDIW